MISSASRSACSNETGAPARRVIRTLCAGHSGRAAIAARVGIHGHRQWLWIPGSRASPAPRNDENLSQNCGLLSIRYKCRMIRLTDEQWERIRDHFPEENIADGRPGRKPVPTRCVLEAVLWILNTGAQWHMLPQSYPNYKTVHRRFQTWCRDEVLRLVLTDVANELRDRGALNEEECFIDATFVHAPHLAATWQSVGAGSHDTGYRPLHAQRGSWKDRCHDQRRPDDRRSREHPAFAAACRCHLRHRRWRPRSALRSACS